MSSQFLVVHVLYDCGDAMGANLVNTACEALAPADRGRSPAAASTCASSPTWPTGAWPGPTCTIATASTIDDNDAIQNSEFRIQNSIVEASLFAEVDPYRAATHNKGIMNGIDAVVIATGNDWRAIEAGAHAYAARERPLHGADARGARTRTAIWSAASSCRWRSASSAAPRACIPAAQVALKLLGVKTARELAEIMACVGLAQNFAAIRALATEGIQHGHMALHARQIAIAAGASGDEVERVAAQLVSEKNVRLERAKEILNSNLG